MLIDGIVLEKLESLTKTSEVFEANEMKLDHHSNRDDVVVISET